MTTFFVASVAAGWAAVLFCVLFCVHFFVAIIASDGVSVSTLDLGAFC